MIKSNYKDFRAGQERYSIEFLSEEERDLAIRRLETWSQNILTLFEIGYETVINGNELEKYGEGAAETARIRKMAGHLIIEWAQCLLMGNEDEATTKRLSEIVSKHHDQAREEVG